MSRSNVLVCLAVAILGAVPLSAQTPETPEDTARAAAVAHPERSALWAEAARTAFFRSCKVAFWEEAYRTSDEDGAPALAASWIGDLLDGGFSRRGLDAWRSLPEPLRGTPEIRALDARLAMAALLTGD